MSTQTAATQWGFDNSGGGYGGNIYASQSTEFQLRARIKAAGLCIQSMKRVTVSLDESHLDTLDEIEAAQDVDSRSEALRRLFEKYEQLQAEYEELHTEYESLQKELQQEREKTKQVLEQREENTELVKYVQQERTQEQRWREAGITTRLRWRIFGMDSDEE